MRYKETRFCSVRSFEGEGPRSGGWPSVTSGEDLVAVYYNGGSAERLSVRCAPRKAWAEHHSFVYDNLY